MVRISRRKNLTTNIRGKSNILQGFWGLILIGLLIALAGASLASSPIKWDPIVPRIIGERYQLPQGAKEAVAGIKKIVAYNWGDLQWDPATVQNGKLFKQMTGVDIEFVGLPDEQMYPKLQAIFLAKSPAVDIVPLDATLYIAFAKAGWLEPLDSLWTSETWKEFAPGLRRILEVDGHIYCVPQVARILTALYYRPSLLKAGGYSRPPKIWDEFDEMIRKFTIDKNGDGIIDQWGYAFSGGGVQDGAYTLMSGMYLLGEKVVQDDGRIVFNSPAAIKVLERLVKMRNEWKVVPPAVTSYQHGDTEDLFRGGKVAMIIEPTSFYADVTDKKNSPVANDVGLAPQPLAYEGGPTTTNLEINMWGVSRFSKAKEAALLFCDWYRSREAAVNELLMESNEPWNLSVLKDQKIKKSLSAEYYHVIQESLKDTRTEIFANQGLVYKTLIREIQNALLGQKTAKKALDDAQAEINRLLKQ